ncbi:MAG: hypothetical protein DCF19_19790 [Pseudanabaena frigida]|uniref:Uncharacterized protein n=1 Tax=Pseudanabaena frigida TaxID=945775 RepID=A0A2W4VYJ1_9CYAN|nr:MAG: hypothetical protein DCF19_19790 [Pseudanabaena frigida]
MKTSHHPLDCELQMRDRKGNLITVNTLELAADLLDGTASIVECFLTFLVSPATYHHIDINESFHLHPDARGQVFGGKLEPDIDVEIETKLDPSFIFEISTKIKTLDALSQHLQTINQNQPDHPLLNTESWFALYVKQSVELPPEFGEGKLKVGYSTTWADT